VEAVLEPRREVPVVRDVDVLVVGGGTAGVPAALAAARLGARTLLVEKFNSFGGAITWGLTITLPPYPIVGAVFNEILRRLRDRYDAVAVRPSEPYFIIFDQELYKYESVLMLEEAGAEMLVDTLAVGAVVEDGAVRGVIVENKSGRQAIRARVTVDCTGDADVAFRSGAATAKAPKDKLLPATMMWVAANVDVARAAEADELGGEPTVVHEGEVNVWGGKAENVDGTDAWDLTAAELSTRKQSVEEWLRRRASSPAWAKSYIGFLAPHLGVRETRRLVGVHVVTADEFHDHLGQTGALPRSGAPRDGRASGGRAMHLHRPAGPAHHSHRPRLRAFRRGGRHSRRAVRPTRRPAQKPAGRRPAGAAQATGGALRPARQAAEGPALSA